MSLVSRKVLIFDIFYHYNIQFFLKLKFHIIVEVIFIMILYYK